MEAARKFCAAENRWKLTLMEESNFKFLKGKVRTGSALGIQSDTVTIDRYNELKKALPGVKFVHLSSEIADIATQKLDNEIANIRNAACVGDMALGALLPLVKKSMTELELARILENLCAERGSEKPAFDTIVLFGERAALPHGRPGSRELKEGDFILIDFGCTVGGFRSDMTRTFVFGSASEEQRKVYDSVLSAQRCARLAARAGMTGAQLDAVARSAIAESGYGEYFGHAAGHGVGLRVHEKPRLHKNNNDPLPENSVVTIEPGIYIPDFGGVRIEDMVVLHKDGADDITYSPRKLIELSL